MNLVGFVTTDWFRFYFLSREMENVWGCKGSVMRCNVIHVRVLWHCIIYTKGRNPWFRSIDERYKNFRHGPETLGFAKIMNREIVLHFKGEGGMNLLEEETVVLLLILCSFLLWLFLVIREQEFILTLPVSENERRKERESVCVCVCLFFLPSKNCYNYDVNQYHFGWNFVLWMLWVVLIS